MHTVPCSARSIIWFSDLVLIIQRHRRHTHFMIKGPLLWCDWSWFPWRWEFNFHHIVTALLPLTCWVMLCRYQTNHLQQKLENTTINVDFHHPWGSFCKIYEFIGVIWKTCAYSYHRNAAKRLPSSGACPLCCLRSERVWPPPLHTGYWRRCAELYSEGPSLMRVFWSPKTKQQQKKGKL